MFNNLENALEAFISSDEFTQALIDSTKEGFAGYSSSVELSPDGTFRTRRDTQMSKLYKTDGIILPLPRFSAEDWQAWEENGGAEKEAHDYDGDLEAELRESFAARRALAEGDY